MYFVHNDSFIKALMVYTDCHMTLCQWVHINNNNNNNNVSVPHRGDLMHFQR